MANLCSRLLLCWILGHALTIAAALSEEEESHFYKPIGTWSGRLLFDPEARLENGSVLLEVHNAPDDSWIGETVELGWNLLSEEGNPELKAYLDFLTVDVHFGTEALKSSKAGRIHPERLNGLGKVGPLESLAGARPENDIYVVLPTDVHVVEDGDKKQLLLEEPPYQARGKKKCLAKFVGPSPDVEDLYEIQHYNLGSQGFEDGHKETIKVPGFPKNNRGLYCSTARQIETSPVNEFGWYLYGQRNEEGVFVVEAWEPRQALLLSPVTAAIGGVEANLDAIKNRIWTGARYKKGRVETILLDPTAEETDLNVEEAVSEWNEGERFLVVHLFGGIGGKIVNESNFVGFIPGHFAFGDATIVSDEFTGELQFRIIHRQVYAHNNGGIISGPNMWSSYSGDLQRGWFGTRPISEIVIKLDALSQVYDFDGAGGHKGVCPLDEMIRELNEMGARYRTGDGDGSALVGSAHSCVQDSNQAMFAALTETERKFKETPGILSWLEANPDHQYVSDLAKVDSLFNALDDYLTPFGVRKDWAATAKGSRAMQKQSFLRTLLETVKTWRTVVPRRAHDALARIFLQHGAKLWFIRTNQVGGNDPDIIPLAPARAFDFHDNRQSPELEAACTAVQVSGDEL